MRFLTLYLQCITQPKKIVPNIKKDSLRKSAAYRFEVAFLERLKAASGATGLTITSIIERCVEKSLNEVLVEARKERDAQTTELQKLLKLRK